MDSIGDVAPSIDLGAIPYPWNIPDPDASQGNLGAFADEEGSGNRGSLTVVVCKGGLASRTIAYKCLVKLTCHHGRWNKTGVGTESSQRRHHHAMLEVAASHLEREEEIRHLSRDWLRDWGLGSFCIDKRRRERKRSTTQYRQMNHNAQNWT